MKKLANYIDGRRVVPGVRLKINENIFTVLHAGEDFIRVRLNGKGRLSPQAKGTILHFGKEKKNYMIDSIFKHEILLRVVTLLDVEEEPITVENKNA